MYMYMRMYSARYNTFILIHILGFSCKFFETAICDQNIVSSDCSTSIYDEDEGHCVTERAIGVKENERRILLIGKTGAGKSTTGNTILNNNTFHAAVSAKSVTEVTKFGTATRFGRHLVVVDTPGLFDTKKNETEIMMEITKCYGMTAPGLHAIVLVLEVGRFTEEEQKTVKFFLNAFGEDVSNFLLVVFAGKNKLHQGGITIQEFISDFETNSPMKNLLDKIENRYIVFGYGDPQQDRDEEVKDLLYMIDEMAKKNGGRFYTNEMYQEAERINRRRFEEAERLAEEQKQKEIDQEVQKFREENAKMERELEAKHGLQKEKYEQIIREKEEKYEQIIREKEEKYEIERQWREERFRSEQRQGYQSGGWEFVKELASAVVNFISNVLSWFF